MKRSAAVVFALSCLLAGAVQAQSGGTVDTRQSTQNQIARLEFLLKGDTSLFAVAPAEVRRLFPQRFVLPFSAWPR